ncbi:membrane-bound transcription factor site-2 protease isoform X2 [Dermatophagoides farinae]|uniref:membrane-bound transcription factor site-2 protease isoform X2 n=1 Tax=Dermatophagoides farinae TaxID=6954 RepID=UPI003F5FF4F2
MEISSWTLIWLLIIFWSFYNIIRSSLTAEYQRKLFSTYGLSLGIISIHLQNESITRWINNIQCHQMPYRRNVYNNQNQKPYCYYLQLIYGYYFKLSILIFYVLFPYAFYQISKSLIYTNEFQQFINHFYIKSNSIDSIDNNKNDDNQLIVMFPGLTLSWIDSLYFFIAICICSLLHEFGHALAANRHSVQIDTFGFQFNLCLPLTFVSIPIEQYLKHDLIAKMEIACAGLMSNFIICLISLFCIVFNPMAIFYTSINDGLLITSVDQSIISGLNEYDVITKVNSVPINSQNDLFMTLNKISKYQTGFCIEHNFIDQFQRWSSCNLEKCCNKSDQRSNLCFIFKRIKIESFNNEYCNVTKELSSSNLYHLAKFESNLQDYYKSCLPAIKVTKMKPLFSFITLEAFNNVEMFFRYLWIISMTMIQFNLLPFSPLDGYQMLTLATDYIESKCKIKSFRLLHRIAHLWSAIIILLYIMLAIFKIINHS